VYEKDGEKYRGISQFLGRKPGTPTKCEGFIKCSTTTMPTSPYEYTWSLEKYCGQLEDDLIHDLFLRAASTWHLSSPLLPFQGFYNNGVQHLGAHLMLGLSHPGKFIASTVP